MINTMEISVTLNPRVGNQGKNTQYLISVSKKLHQVQNHVKCSMIYDKRCNIVYGAKTKKDIAKAREKEFLSIINLN